jgi:hypothetical protein
VDPDKLRTLKVYVSQPERDIASDRQEFQFFVEDKASTEKDVYDATFNAPE